MSPTPDSPRTFDPERSKMNARLMLEDCGLTREQMLKIFPPPKRTPEEPHVDRTALANRFREQHRKYRVGRQHWGGGRLDDAH